MKELRRIFRLIKYGYGFKLTMVLSVVLTVLGLVFLGIGYGMPYGDNVQPALLCTLYIMLGPISFIQILYSLLFSNMVKASPKNYTLDILVPNRFIIITGSITYLLSFVGAWIGAKRTPALAESYVIVILGCGLFVAVLAVYFAIAYKYFVAGTIGFLVGFLGVYGGIAALLLKKSLAFTMTSASLLGAAVAAVGIVVSCILRRLLYKKPVSKLASGASLRKMMK